MGVALQLDMSLQRLKHAALVLVLIVPVPAYAQARFRSGIDLVALDVCVKDRNGNPVTKLGPDDFLVLENNVPQKISLFSGDGYVPLAVSLLIDNSHSMDGVRIERARAAASGLIDVLRPGDLVEVVSFNGDVNLRYPMGPDHAQAKRALNDLTAAGMTALREAMLVALNEHKRARRHRDEDYREVIVLLSDGQNTTGHVTFDDMLEEVRRSGVMVYTISLRTDEHDRVLAPSWEMTQLAFNTGGRAIAVRDLNGLSQIYQEIAAELLHLYRVGYVPSKATRDGQWRQVSVRAPSKNLVIRARSGYYAPRPGTKGRGPEAR